MIRARLALMMCVGFGCSSTGRIASETVAVESSIPYVAAVFPVSAGAAVTGSNVTITFLDVVGAKSSCDVLQRVGIDGIAYAVEITLTFPNGAPAGRHALADIGASATVRINDGTCAPAHTDATTSGTLWFAETHSVIAMDLRFTLGRVLANNIAAPSCGATAPGDASTCVVLGPCADPGSLSCLWLGS